MRVVSVCPAVASDSAEAVAACPCKSLARFALLACALSAAACGDLLSLHPLYTSGDRVFDAAIESRWGNENVRLLVERMADGYLVTTEDTQESAEKYEVHLVDIAGIRFADILWTGAIGHIFARVRITDNQLHLAFFDSPWVQQQIPHEQAEVDRGETRAVLTASTPELQRIVASFARDARAYDPEELVLRRAK